MAKGILNVGGGVVSVDASGNFTVDTGLIADGASVFNETGVDVDFRIESDDNVNMLFVDGGNDRVGIGVATPAAQLEVEQSATGGVVAFTIDNNDTDKVAMSIEAANIDADVMDITMDAVTTAKGIDITADGLTTGSALYIDDNSASTSTRNTIDILQNNAAAIAATALKVQSDGGITGITLDKNFTDVAAATVTGLHVDFDRTVPGSGTATFTDIGIKLDVNAAGLGTTTTTGLDIDVGGATSGTHTAIGLAVDVGSADTNYAALFNGGNVGIGTTAPSETLHIEGTTSDVLIKNTGATAVKLYGDCNASSDEGFLMDISGRWNGTRIGVIGFTAGPDTTNKDDGSIVFYTAAPTLAERMRIDHSGKVGIGTTAPRSPIHLHASASDFDPASHVIISSSSIATGDLMGIGFNQRDENDAKAWFGTERMGDYGVSDFVFLLDNAGDDNPVAAGDEVMRITRAGLVGIGTTAPGNSLHVYKGGGNLYAEIETTDANAAGIILHNSAKEWSIYNRSTGYLTFYESTGANIGIHPNGTIYPNASQTSAYIRNVTSYNNSYHFSQGQSLEGGDRRTPATDDWGHGSQIVFTSWDLNNGNTYADLIYMNTYSDGTGGEPNGLIINKGSNGVKVSRRAHGNGSADNYLKDGAIYTLDHTNASDERVKENVITIDSALSKINQLRPVTYNWTDEYIEAGASKNASENIRNEKGDRVSPETKVENVGLIAQEVLKIIPTVVHNDNVSMPETEEYLYDIDYSKLIPHMVRSIQELSAEVTALKNA